MPVFISAMGTFMGIEYFHNLLLAEFQKSLNKVRDENYKMY